MAWLSRFRNLFRAARVSDDIEREMAFHLAERTDDLVAAGVPRRQAEREARRRFGNLTVHKERTREHDLLTPIESVVADLRYALRACRAAPGFTLVAVLSLALGIGANTAIFSVINDVMLRSLPVDEPGRLVMLTRGAVGARGSASFTAAMWEGFRRHADLFADLFAYGSTSVDLRQGGEARRVGAGFVSGAFFPALGIRPAAGRLLAPADDRPGCPAIAVITHAFWRSDFGSSPAAIGASIPLDGHPFQVVGVAEPSFFGIEVGYRPPVWVPLCAEPIVRGSAGGGYAAAWDA